MSTLPAAERNDLDRVRRWSLGVGVVALVICVIGAFFDPAQFFCSYLAAYLFWQGIALGCLAILMVYHLTGGAWGLLIRRFLEAGTWTIPLLALLFIPVGCGLWYLYLWARPDRVAADPKLQWKQVYLNVPFWWLRAIIYFVLWTALTWFLNTWSRREDATGDPRIQGRLARLSAFGLVVFGVCMHFAAVDWIMSLQPDFRSSIFGPLMVSRQVLSGLALMLVVMTWLADRPPLRDLLSVEALGDLGNLLLTFLIIWAYMAFFQFMLIWIANLPFEVIWYLDRTRGGWRWVAWALIVFGFAVPFFLLLQRPVKRNPANLRWVAGLVLFMQLVFTDFQVLPAFFTTSIAEHWMDFLMPLGVGGIWFAFFLRVLKSRPLVARHDVNQPSAVRLRRMDAEAAEREAAISHG
ncbi:MAG TPA: hypothetical protein VFA26_15360 [Gemmataceae bacterium]|nr:hypothetical protein [Gemmataceae bacterium]